MRGTSRSSLRRGDVQPGFATVWACPPVDLAAGRADQPGGAARLLLNETLSLPGRCTCQNRASTAGPARSGRGRTMTAQLDGARSQQDDPHGGGYDPAVLQDRWRPVWEKLDPFRAGSGPQGARRTYVLDAFPYPSGDLHMGHAEAFVIGDVVARYRWLRGDDVLHPIGWDSFGLPAEDAAIARGSHPADWTYANIATQAESFRRYAVSFDWSRRLHTSDPEYYRWTQWLFLRMYEKGLAYRKSSPVNWCPNDQTVLANEQVVD